MSFDAYLTVNISKPGDAIAAQVTHLAEHDLHPLHQSEREVAYETPFGRFQAHILPDGLKISVQSEAESGLEVIKQSIADHLLAFQSDLSADNLIWTGHESGETHPANFREMTVLSKTILGPGMIRVTLQGPDLQDFAETGLHMRLLIQDQPQRQPVWPLKRPSGQVRYPDGEDLLHSRVYTIRAIRPELGELDVDLVRHEGGVAADWAEQAESGMRVGMVGPGGGFFPPENWLLIGGDETALPAIARILENRQAHSRGIAVISLRDPLHKLELQVPDGMEIKWISDNKNALLSAMKSVDIPKDEPVYGWFGAEQAEAQEIRKYFRDDLGLARGRFMSVAYWRKGEAGR